MAIRFMLEPIALPPIVSRRGLGEQIIREERIRAVNEMVLLISQIMFQVSPRALGTLERAWKAGMVPAQVRGDNVVGKVGALGAGGLEALVWDEGAKPHFPPVRKPPSSPALATWIRRQLGSEARIFRGGKKVPADISDPGHVREIAFAISRKIKQRGLPNPRHPKGFKKGLFTKAFIASRTELLKIQERMSDRILARLSKAS